MCYEDRVYPPLPYPMYSIKSRPRVLAVYLDECADVIIKSQKLWLFNVHDEEGSVYHMCTIDDLYERDSDLTDIIVRDGAGMQQVCFVADKFGEHRIHILLFPFFNIKQNL